MTTLSDNLDNTFNGKQSSTTTLAESFQTDDQILPGAARLLTDGGNTDQHIPMKETALRKFDMDEFGGGFEADCFLEYAVQKFMVLLARVPLTAVGKCEDPFRPDLRRVLPVAGVHKSYRVEYEGNGLCVASRSRRRNRAGPREKSLSERNHVRLLTHGVAFLGGSDLAALALEQKP